MRTAALFFGAALVAALVPGAAWAHPTTGQAVDSTGHSSYHTVRLGTLGGPLSEARAMNEHGQVVGYSSTPESYYGHPFLWQNGVMVDLGTLNGQPTGMGIATDINNRGEIVGSSTAPSGGTHAFLWRHGVLTDLGAIGDYDQSFASGINDRGQVVGSFYSTDGEHGFLWQDGVMTDLGVSNARDINDRGQITGGTMFATGFHAYRMDRRAVTDLGALAPGYSQGVAINTEGQVLGWTNTDSGTVRAFLWQRGVMTDVPMVNGSDLGLNNRGQVVGGGMEHPLMWQNGLVTDLTTRGVPADATLRDINDRGQICGTTTFDGYPGAAIFQQDQT